VKLFLSAKASWGPLRAVKCVSIVTAPVGELEWKEKVLPVAGHLCARP